MSESNELKPDTYTLETDASNMQMKFREELAHKFQNTPLPLEHLMCNFGLYMRSSVLVKFLVIDDLYRRILNIPGEIVEFGTWWGQNLVLFENLRAIYEPFNTTRSVIGFDTFQGYANFSKEDIKGEVFHTGGYSVAKNYKEQLKALLEIHEGINVMGHIRGKHTLVEGDVTETAPRFFADHPELIVALAYFDMGLYKPTKAALNAIKPHLVPGSVILLDELTCKEAPGEAIAFREIAGEMRYRIEKSRYTPMRSIVTFKG